jgi:hypothetical protein
MKTRTKLVLVLALALTLIGAALTMDQQAGTGANVPPSRPKGPCDIYAASDPCVAAHSTTRALYAAYNGPLYEVLRQSDAKTLDIGVVQPSASPVPDAGGYANAAAQDAFCANTYCWITTIYDQSPKKNHLIQAPRGGFSGPAMGGFNNLPVADMAPVTIMGHKVYGVFIAPGMGLRQNDTKGTAVDDQAEGQYWVINGHHYNSGCCFDYGNAETDSRDDGNGTMETTYYGNATAWYHGNTPGPWIMTDQENNLVGCVNKDASKLCDSLPNIGWRFVTAIAKGEPHHWTSLGGDGQKGNLRVMFDGPRVNASYDPMRKQGAILLGNGGDNSVGSQGTFYEGAMTAAGTFPTDATDQLVQANVVAARYDVARLSLASAIATPPGLQTFSPGSSQDTALSFTNTTGVPVTGVKLSLSVPRQWTSVAAGATPATIAGPVAPGATVSATFKVTSGPAAFNGDLVGNASWTANGRTQSETTIEKVRNVSPIKINEFRVSDGSTANSTNSFIELYNAGASAVDISNWTLTQHPTQQAIFSSVKIPAATRVALTLLSARPLHFRTGGPGACGRYHHPRQEHDRHERRRYDRNRYRRWNGDAQDRQRRHAGRQQHNAVAAPPRRYGDHDPRRFDQRACHGYRRRAWRHRSDRLRGGREDRPRLWRHLSSRRQRRGEIRGRHSHRTRQAGHASLADRERQSRRHQHQGFLLVNITAGDKIRLDIDSVGHGIETVTVKTVGTASVRNAFTGPLPESDLGTGLELTAPLKFNRSSNIPSSARGTGITFQPATAFSHSSNEPVQSLGTGITLDQPLAKAHAIDAVVRDAAVTTAGYQGTPAPNQWFGGPALSPAAGAMISARRRRPGGRQLELRTPRRPLGLRGLPRHIGAGEGGRRVPARRGGTRRFWRAERSGGQHAASESGPLPRMAPTATATATISSCSPIALCRPLQPPAEQHQGRERSRLRRRSDDYDRYGSKPRAPSSRRSARQALPQWARRPTWARP